MTIVHEYVDEKHELWRYIFMISKVDLTHMNQWVKTKQWNTIVCCFHKLNIST